MKYIVGKISYLPFVVNEESNFPTCPQFKLQQHNMQLLAVCCQSIGASLSVLQPAPIQQLY